MTVIIPDAKLYYITYKNYSYTGIMICVNKEF